MNLRQFQRINRERSNRWMNSPNTPLMYFSNAMAGETGEVCNAVKKLERVHHALPNKEAGVDKHDIPMLEQKVANECADAIIYALIILDQLSFDASAVIADVFDKKSIEYGFPERAPR